MQLITGNTYPVKDSIKALGGRWNKTAKGWEVPDEQAEAARAIVTSAGPAEPYTPTRRPSSYAGNRRGYGSNYARFSSGAEVFTNKRGRCEDAPCCGCCS